MTRLMPGMNFVLTRGLGRSAELHEFYHNHDGRAPNPQDSIRRSPQCTMLVQTYPKYTLKWPIGQAPTARPSIHRLEILPSLLSPISSGATGFLSPPPPTIPPGTPHTPST